MSCENDLGIADALGNVFEWTLDAYRPSVAGEKPISPHHIVKGGSFISDNTVRLFSRFMFKPDFTANIIGFRCLAD
jgi:formylglycine-generating enzyme required for sulfatase activity